MNFSKVYKSRVDKVINGVCGGLGNSLTVDPFLFRIAFIWGFLGMRMKYFMLSLILYSVLSIAMPLAPVNQPIRRYTRLYRSKKDAILSGVLGGLADILGIHSTIIRITLSIAFVSIIVLGHTEIAIDLLVAYAAATILLPQNTFPLQESNSLDVGIDITENLLLEV